MATPLSADKLLKALRDEGLHVVEHRSWRTNNRNHKGAWGPTHGVMIHHTVTSGTTSSVELCYNGHSTLPGPLCHGVIDKAGTVHLVGNGRTNHAGSGDDDVLQAVITERPLPADNEANTDGNRHFYGFECVNLGDGKDPWPTAQLDAIERASAAVCRAHGWSQRSVIGHLEWQPGKIDPRGFTMDSMRGRIAKRLGGDPSKPAPTAPTSPKESHMPLTKADVEALAKTDGIFKAPKDSTTYATNRHWSLASHIEGLTTNVRLIRRTQLAQVAAIQTLAGLVGKGVDTAAVVAAVERAITDAVITVDVDINSKEG